MQRTSTRAGSLFEALGGVSNFSVNSGSSSARDLSGGVLGEAFDKSRDKEKAELEKAGYAPDNAGEGFVHPSGARAEASGNHTVVTNADGKASVNLGRGKLTDFRKALKDATKNKLVDDLKGRIDKIAQLVNSASGEVLGLDADPRLTPAQATAAGSLDAALRAAVTAVTPLYSRVLREAKGGDDEIAALKQQSLRIAKAYAKAYKTSADRDWDALEKLSKESALSKDAIRKIGDAVTRTRGNYRPVDVYQFETKPGATALAEAAADVLISGTRSGEDRVPLRILPRHYDVQAAMDHFRAEQGYKDLTVTPFDAKVVGSLMRLRPEVKPQLIAAIDDYKDFFNKLPKHAELVKGANEAAPSRSAVRSLLNDELIPVQTVHEFVDVVVANYGSKATLREALAELSSMMGRIEAEAEGLLKDNWDALRAEVVKA